MTRRLRAVAPGETAPAAPPKTLVDATELDRRALLVRSRLEIAKVIDAGVPAHALGRLITDMERIDSEIRRLDAVAAQEAERSASVADEAFDSEAI